MTPAVVIAKSAAALMTNPQARKAAGWLLAAVLSPAILLITFLCALATGGVEHNNLMVQTCFYGSDYAKVPEEFEEHITQMREAFSILDSTSASVSAQMENGSSLDSVRIKAVFYALCFGEQAPNQRAANNFVECFYTTETRTRTVEITDEDGTVTTKDEQYTVIVPVSMESAYANLSNLLGRPVTDDDKSNVNHIYKMVARPTGGGSGGAYLRGDGSSADMDISNFKDPSTKNAADLVAYAVNAWESGWGYVWGTFGDVLTDSLFAYKLEQYPEGVGEYADFIQTNWLGGRTADCVGLIKGYSWLNPDTLVIEYGTNGMPDIGCDTMFYDADEKGQIETIPEIPGIAVWHEGHIGVYIGNGEVIEAMGTRYGVVKTQLAGSSWTHWLKVKYIQYN